MLSVMPAISTMCSTRYGGVSLEKLHRQGGTAAGAQTLRGRRADDPLNRRRTRRPGNRREPMRMTRVVRPRGSACSGAAGLAARIVVERRSSAWSRGRPRSKIARAIESAWRGCESCTPAADDLVSKPVQPRMNHRGGRRWDLAISARDAPKGRGDIGRARRRRTGCI